MSLAVTQRQAKHQTGKTRNLQLSLFLSLLFRN